MSDASFVVVGGSKGIGLGIVKRLVDAGEKVVVLSRTSTGLEGLNGVSHLPVDLSADEVFTESLPERIKGLAYCPGSLNLKMFRSLKPEAFRSDFEVNVIGAVKSIQAAMPGLKATKNSSLLMFSTVAVGQGMVAHASIAASKGAIEGLTRSLASELAPNTRVNCIAPALTDTPLAERFFASQDKVSAMSQKYPLKRTGNVDDLAAMSVFLMSDQASWITGQVVGVDGGMSSVH